MSKNPNIDALESARKYRAKLPDSWIKAAGILRGRKPDALQELKKMRKEWDAYSKKLQKLRRA